MRRTIRMEPWRSLGLIMLAVFVLSMGMASWALYERFTQTNERREYQADVNRQMVLFRAQQESINARITQVSLDYCREIEKLKAERRRQVNEAYANRGRDFRLLGIRRTAEIEEILRQNRAKTLDRFKEEPCPRPRRNP